MDINAEVLKILESIWNNPQMMMVVWIVLPLIIFGLLMKVPAFKGWIGEMFLHFGFKWLLPGDRYHLFRNVTLPTTDGTTQIDHVVVSECGIFVIETKNMKGWIFASQNSKVWTQQIYRHKNKFQNPLRQNYKHTKTLAQILDLPDEKLHSMIAFVGGATFKKEKPENVLTRGWPSYIKSFSDKILSPEEVLRCCEQISENRLEAGWQTHRQHVAHVKEIVANKSIKQKVLQEPSNERICPRCGSQLVERVAKRGPNTGNSFWGCSRYPKCRYSKQKELK